MFLKKYEVTGEHFSMTEGNWVKKKNKTFFPWSFQEWKPKEAQIEQVRSPHKMTSAKEYYKVQKCKNTGPNRSSSNLQIKQNASYPVIPISLLRFFF